MTSPQVTFQYFSDVHTELYKPKLDIKPLAPYLLLAGDIGDPTSSAYRDFLALLSPQFKTVFVTSGNHEYYTTSTSTAAIGNLRGENWLSAVDDYARKVCYSFPNISFLQNESIDLLDSPITVYGGTFWTKPDPKERYNINCFVMDYRGMIPGFTVELSESLHSRAVSQLKKEIAATTSASRSLVVMSHHLPSYSLIDPKYIHSTVNSVYAAHIEDAYHPCIKAWVAGHTHSTVQRDHFYVSPIGYGDDNPHASYNRTFTI